MVEEGIREQAELLDEAEAQGAAAVFGGMAIEPRMRVRLPSGGTGEVMEVRGDGTAVVAVGVMKIVLEATQLTPLPPMERAGRKPQGEAPVSSARPGTGDAASLEVDLRGLTGDEAEQATIAAVDAAVLAEQPFLRIIHGMGTGVVRDRVRRVVSGDRRVARFGFAPRNQGGSGVTIVEFSA